CARDGSLYYAMDYW
nr:immunoglobulin heavy chain junction region [Mus musculus]